MMPKLLIIILSLTIGLIEASYADNPFSADQSFGGQIPTEGESITLKEAISQIGSSGDQFLKIEG